MKLRPLDYHRYHDQQRVKLARRNRNWEHQAYEDVLALLLIEHPDKTTTDCIIALANMAIYAPLIGPD